MIEILYEKNNSQIKSIYLSSKAPVYEMVGHEDKILCVDWSIPNMILTGSADNTFKLFKTADVMN